MNGAVSGTEEVVKVLLESEGIHLNPPDEHGYIVHFSMLPGLGMEGW